MPDPLVVRTEVYLPGAGGCVAGYLSGRFSGASDLGVEDLGAGEGPVLSVGNGAVLPHREALAGTRLPVNLVYLTSAKRAVALRDTYT